MANGDNVQPWLNKTLVGLVSLVCLGGISFCGWVTVMLLSHSEALASRPTKAEVEKIAIAVTAPMTRDQQHLSTVLGEMKATQPSMTDAVRKNTEAIIRLNVTMENLLSIKPADVLQAVKDLDKRLNSRLDEMR